MIFRNKKGSWYVLSFVTCNIYSFLASLGRKVLSLTHYSIPLFGNVVGKHVITVLYILFMVNILKY